MTKQHLPRPTSQRKKGPPIHGTVGGWSFSPQPYLLCLWNGPLSLICVAGQPQEMVYPKAYISWACAVPLLT